MEKSKHKCDKCFKVCRSQRGLKIHRTRVHPYAPPPKPVPETSEHVNYIDLVINNAQNWGQEMTKHKARHPERDQLMLGAVFAIMVKLDAILEELKRTKTIK